MEKIRIQGKDPENENAEGASLKKFFRSIISCFSEEYLEESHFRNLNWARVGYEATGQTAGQSV